MGITTVSVLTAILVAYLHHKDGSKRAPRWLRVFTFRILANMLCMCRSVPMKDQEVHDNGAKNARNPSRATDVVTVEEIRKGIPEKVLDHVPASAELRSIMENLEYLTDKVRKQEAEEKVIDEWRALAMIFDRLMFWASLLVLVVTLTALLYRQDVEH